MGCNILLQTGGKIIKQAGDGFLLLTNCVIDAGLDIIHGPNNRNWRVDWENEQYRKAKERERIKQDEIIALRLEAQEITVAKKDAELTPPSKQRDKQIAAAEARLAELLLIIRQESLKLAMIEKKIAVQRHNMAMIAIIAASPFGMARLTN